MYPHSQEDYCWQVSIEDRNMMVQPSGRVSSVLATHLRYFQSYFQVVPRKLPFGCAALLLSAASPVSLAQAIGMEEHGAWISSVIFADESVVSRAAVGQENHGRPWLLSVDSPIEDCQTINISLWVEDKDNTLLSSTLRTGSVGAIGQVRVDERGTHDFVYLVVTEGSGIALIITYADDNGQLIRDIDNGNVIRFKLRFGDEDYFARFPLKGARAAIDRQDLLCRQLELPKSDESYFSDPPPPAQP